MEREACVCDHGYERSDLCAEIIIIIIIWLALPVTNNVLPPQRFDIFALCLVRRAQDLDALFVYVFSSLCCNTYITVLSILRCV